MSQCAATGLKPWRCGRLYKISAKHNCGLLKNHRLGIPEGDVLCVRNKLECVELYLVMSDELRAAVLGGNWRADQHRLFLIGKE